MIARQVGWMRRVVVASPALLHEVSEPEQPVDLANKPCVRFRGLAAQSWRFRRNGAETSVPVDGPFASNQATSAVDACVAGLGFGQFLYYQVEQAIRQRQLSLLLEEFELPPVPVSLVYTEGRLMSPRLKVCVNALQDKLARTLEHQ